MNIIAVCIILVLLLLVWMNYDTLLSYVKTNLMPAPAATEGMSVRNYIPGLQFRSGYTAGYTDAPNYDDWTQMRRDRYVVGGPNVNFRSTFESDPSSNKSLNELTTDSSLLKTSNPAMQTNDFNDQTQTMWLSDASTKKDIYNQDGYVDPSVQLNDDDMDQLIRMAINRTSDAKLPATPSLCGTVFTMTDYAHPSRSITA